VQYEVAATLLCSSVKRACHFTTITIEVPLLLEWGIDREFEFYEFFSFLKFNEFYEFFVVEKNSQNIRNFANHRCLTCFDVLECNVHL